MVWRIAWVSVLLVGLTSLAAGADAPVGGIDLKQFDREILLKRLAGGLEEVRATQPSADFKQTCEDLHVILKEAVEHAPSEDTSANAKSLHESTASKVGFLLSGKEQGTAWVIAYNKFIQDLQQNQEGGFRSNSVAHWTALYQLGIEVLDRAKTGQAVVVAAPPPATPAATIAASVFTEVDFSDDVYNRLLGLDVVRMDHSFPKTVQKLIDALKNELAKADRTPPASSAQFFGDCVRAIAAVIADVDGPLARKQWGEALQQFLGELEKSPRFNAANTESEKIVNWRHAFSQLIQGLEKAIKKDTAFVAELARNRGNIAARPGTLSGTAAGTTASGYYGGAGLHSVMHARRMAHIHRVHEVRMAKIRMIRGN